jgi:arsenite methyltransferase
MTTIANELRDGVREAYSFAAETPGARHPFPVGAAFAREVGYDGALPDIALEAFAGVSNVAVFADLHSDARVLDLGCGAGLDSIVAGRRARMVLGLDFSAAMLRRALQAACGGNVAFVQGDAERLPLGDGSIDIALVNGIFNLNPARDAIFGELARVVKPGGAVYGAELILREPLSADQRGSTTNWFS